MTRRYWVSPALLANLSDLLTNRLLDLTVPVVFDRVTTTVSLYRQDQLLAQAVTWIFGENICFFLIFPQDGGDYSCPVPQAGQVPPALSSHSASQAPAASEAAERCPL